jgi:hypothetical protein
MNKGSIAIFVARASSLWGDRAFSPVIRGEATGKMPVGPTAKIPVLQGVPPAAKS